MLGEKIGEEQGQITGVRVLSVDGDPKLEVSFQGTGNLLGVETTDIGTYESVMRPDGTIYGEGHGVIMTADGEGVTWKGAGVGTPTGVGMAVSYRGAIYFSTASEKLAALNTYAAVYEFDVDENGATSATFEAWR